MSAERDEYIDRVTRHIVPADDHEARASMTRGARRGASSAWQAKQPIVLRGEEGQ